MEATQRELSPLWQAAIEHAKQGLHVFPLKKKIPLKGTRGFKDATDHIPTIESWSTRFSQATDIGIATGEVSGIIVIDIDPGKGGREAIIKLQQELGALPQDCMASTPSGGLHLYYAWPAGVDLRNTASKLGVGIDTRANGGLVGAPGSPGREWINKSDEWPELPTAWIERLKKPKEQRSSLAGARAREGRPVIVGERNDYMIRYVGDLCRTNASADEIFAAARAHAHSVMPDPLEDKELRDMIESARNRWEPDAPAPERVDSAVSLVRQLPDLLAKDGGAACEPSMLEALRTVRDTDPPEFERACDVLRGRSKMLSVKNGIKLLDAAEAKKRAAEAVSDIEPAADAPAPHIIPPPWSMGEAGIWGNDKEGVPMRVCASDLYIKAHLHDVADGPERIQLTFRRHGQLHTISAARETVATRASIVKLANDGMDINSENAGQMVRFIADLINANATGDNKIPVLRHTSKTGWLGSGHFFPGKAGDVVFDPGESDMSMANAFTPNGDPAEWLAMASKLRDKWPLVRLMFATSFAAPLVSRLGQRAFMLNIWGGTGGGKTAGMTAAISAWGNPNVLVGGFNGTEYFMAKRAVNLSDTMLCLNERQTVGDKKLSALIYTLIEGVSRGQGLQSGGVRPTLRWKNAVLVNGEEPLTPVAGTAGVANRILDVHGRPIDDEHEASAVYGDFAGNYGHGATPYIEGLLAHERSESGILKAEYELVAHALTNRCPDASKAHVASMSLIVLADWYSGMWVFGNAENEAFDSALKNGAEILSEVEGMTKGEDYRNAYDFIHEMVSGNRTKFFDLSGYESWGFIENGRLFIYPNVLKRELEDHGYPYRATLQWMSDKDLVETEANGKKRRRLTIRKKGSPMVSIRLADDFQRTIGQDEDIQ